MDRGTDSEAGGCRQLHAGGNFCSAHLRLLSDFWNLTSDHAWFTVVRVENEENDTTGLNWVISLSIPDRGLPTLLALEEPLAEETPEAETPGDRLTLSGITLELKDTLAKGDRVDLRTEIRADGTLCLATGRLTSGSETEPVAVNLRGGDFVELLLTGTASNRALIRREGEKEGKDSNTYYYVLKKIDAEDGHALKGARFGLYVDDEQIATAVSGSEGYVRFALDERDYNKLSKNDDIYVTELTAPEGYVKSSREYSVSPEDFVKNNVLGAQKQALTVANARTSTPGLLNDDDRFAYVRGYKDGTVRPDAYITRAQAMTMINRVLNRIPEDADDLRKDMNVWPDCNPGDWFYLAVQEATNSHDYKHKAGSCETWTGMNGDPDWSRYEN